MSSVLFAIVGGVLAICAVFLWRNEAKKPNTTKSKSPEEDLAAWVHQCRGDGNGRLVAAVCDSQLKTSHRLEALREVVAEYTSLGLPSQQDAYKLLSAREDVDRALRAGVNDNNVGLVRASLVALSKYEIDGHTDSVCNLLNRILTNPNQVSATLRGLALRYLTIHGSVENETVLIDVMEMGTAEDRGLAIIGLQAYGTALAVPALHATAADPAMAALRGQALAAIGAIQARIGPLDNGLLSLSEEAGRLSIASQGGQLSSTRQTGRRAV